MGTKVQCKSNLPGHNPMNNRNDNSNICNWPLLYGDKSICGPYYNGFFPTPTPETYVGGEKDAVRLTMLEHEAIFKNQVYELHRLYRIQRDMMEEIKRKKIQERGDGFLSAKLIPAQIASENVQKCQFTGTTVAYSSSSRQSISVAEEIHSFSPVKGNNREVGPYRSPNEGIVKEFERPTKSKKLLDLQLPADEYIDSDEDEQTHDKKKPEMSDYLPKNNQTHESDKHNDKAGCSILWNSNGFGDLNEPLQLEETNILRRDDFTRETSFDGETRNIDLSSKPSGQLLYLSREISLNSSYGSNNATQNNHDVEKSRNGRGVFSNLLKAGNSKDFEKSKLPLWSKPFPGFLNEQAEQKDEPEKNLEISFHKHLGGFTTSQLTNPYQVSPDFNLNRSWPRSFSSREKQSCETTMSVERQPGCYFDSSVTTFHKSSNSVAQSNGLLHGSASGFKDGAVCYSSTSYDYPKFISNNNRASEKIHEASNYFDMNSPVGINSNVACSYSSSDGATHHLAFTIEHGKAQNEKQQSLIPWLKAMYSSMNEAENSSRLVNDGEISFAQSSVHQNKMENGDCPKKAHSHLVKFGSCSDDVVERSLESKKVLGFAIFDKSRVSKTESFSVTSPSEKCEREDGRKIRALDINLPCDPSVQDSETGKSHTVTSSGHQIDLNLCLSEDEQVFDIDLEAPAVPELIENILIEEVENLGERVIIAAKALVSISSWKNVKKEEGDSRKGSLQWFVDIALSNESTAECIDHFEAMTLSLKEITEEEFMPKPPFPNDRKFEESVNFSQTRLRRGQSRRGRQRRDFQRDVLPGLTTLSRHEVTEDLQAFSDLMTATGHSFSGLTRRNTGRNNGSGRGRRKAVVTPSPLQNTSVACNIEAGLEDRSLTGWGKTIRRPRRQRIPAGNLNVVQLS